MIWVVVCLLALIADQGYRGASDWQMEEGLAFEMMVFIIPILLRRSSRIGFNGSDPRLVWACVTSIQQTRNDLRLGSVRDRWLCPVVHCDPKIPSATKEDSAI